MKRATVLTVGMMALQSFLAQSGVVINENTKLNDEGIYLRTLLTGKGGTIDLVTSNIREVTGVTNLDRPGLPPGVNMALEGIRFGYVKTAAADGEKDPAKVKYSNQYDDVDPALANAQLVISQQGEIIFSIPISRLLSGSKTQGNLMEQMYEVQAIKHIKPEVKLDIQIRFPEGVNLDADNHLVELHLIGARTQRKS